MSSDDSIAQLRLDAMPNEHDMSMMEPDYDHLAPTEEQSLVAEEAATAEARQQQKRHQPLCSKPLKSTHDDGMKKGASSEDDNYILGTLIVRVVAARGLENGRASNSGRSIFGVSNSFGGNSRGSVNPYASVKFGNTTQRTSEVFNSVDPVWPRHESFYLDVSLPLHALTHNPPSEIAAEASIAGDKNTEHDAPNSVLSVAIFNGTGNDKLQKPKGKAGGGIMSGDSDDTFLGMASIDLIQLLTGMRNVVDKWMPLSGAGSSNGRVRVVCEYETNEPTLKAGDYCRFTQFCRPEDLHPLVPYHRYRVSGADGDAIQISYRTPEGWMCAFQTHRFMLTCDEQISTAAQICQEELASISERISHSIVASSLTETINRLPVDGILAISNDVIHGGLSVCSRWFQGGIDMAVSDIVHATNWDGRFDTTSTPSLDIPRDDDGEESQTGSETDEQGLHSMLNIRTETDAGEEDGALPNMPSCPITGEPMIAPVVAADGHTYEKAAIKRWLKTSDTSPLTGMTLAHKNLVPNYGLISSLEAAAAGNLDDIE